VLVATTLPRPSRSPFLRWVSRVLLAAFTLDGTALARTLPDPVPSPGRAAEQAWPPAFHPRLDPLAVSPPALAVAPAPAAPTSSFVRTAPAILRPEVLSTARTSSSGSATAPIPAVVEIGSTVASEGAAELGDSGTNTATAEHTYPAGWSLASVPLLLANGSPSVVFGDVAPPRRLYDYVDGQTLAPGDAGFRNVVPGRAYWMLLSAATTVHATGQPVATGAEYRIAIKPGWNVVATPWFSSVEWSDVQVSVRNGLATHALGAAVTDGWIEGTLDDPDPAGAYATLTANSSPAGLLRPWRGYLLFSNVTGELIFAAPPADTTPPTASFTGIADGSVITAPTEITGTIDDANLLEWRLEYAPAGSALPVVLGHGDGPVTNAVLGTFDPTVLLNGTYDVRIVATDVGGTTTTVTRSVVVRGNLKVGNFRISFVDLEVPLAGLPIRVVRTYDSRDKRKGDFGVGWRIELTDLKLSRNVPAGLDWTLTKSGGFLPNYCVEPSRSHLVTVTFPDGKVYEFEAGTTPQCQQIAPPQFVTVTYHARSGTVGSLAPLDGGTVFLSGGAPGPVQLLDDSTLEIYDSSGYLLTLPDGRAFAIDRQQGLQSITDLNGNQLTVGPNGVVHSSGTGIAFARDGSGRITAITDPAGHVLTYAYDASGDLVTSSDREEKATTYEYDGNHGLLAVHDPRGVQPVRSEYDDAGRLLRVTDALGHVTEYTHDVAGRQEIVRDRVGRVSVLEYDDRGNVIVQTDPDGLVTRRTFDLYGNKLSETDPIGHTTTYTYDASSNLTSTTDALGQVTSFTYNSRGQELTKKDPRGGVSTSTYDARGNLTSFLDTAGQTTTYGYDTRGNHTSVTEPGGCVTRYEYDLAGHVLKKIDALGRETTYTYDATGLRLSERRTRTRAGVSEALVTTFTYDRMGREIETKRPDGEVETSEYDDAGRLVARVDALGRRTTMVYDDMGRLVRTTHPDGTSEETAYDGEDRVVSSTDRGGRVTTFENDARGQLTRSTYPDGSVVARSYDAAGHLATITDARGSVTRYEYDAGGRKTRVIDPAGRPTTFTYDGNGNQVTARDPSGNLTTSEYDGMNRRTRVLFPDGSDRKTTYDAAGRVLTETDQAGRITRFAYDCLGHLAQVTDAAGQVTAHEYDEVGERVAQTDAAGHRTTFEFDLLGREVKRTLPSSKSQSRAYDLVGNLLTRTSFGGITVAYTYDAADRLVSRSQPGQAAVAFTYTPAGQRATVTDDRGTTRYQYDLRDRLTRLEQPGAGVLEYEYDGRGNRTLLRASAGGTTYVARYAYDVAARLTGVTDPLGRTYTLGYDPNGNRTSLSRPNGTATSYAYDALNRLTTLTAQRSGLTFQSYAYTLGPTGLRTRVDEGDGTRRDYAYDALSRLTQETVAGLTVAYTKAFTYDAVGNRLTQSDSRTGLAAYTYDATDRLLTDGASTYTWDDDGSLRTRSAPDGAAYVWDAEQRLVRVTRPDGTLVTHAYDADGNRVRTDVTPSTGPPSSTTFLVDPAGALSQVVLDLDSGGAPQAFYLRADDLLAIVRPTGTRFVHADGLGSIRALTDEAGTVTDLYSYTAFGELLAHIGSDPNPYQFAGEPLDPNSGFYYNRARWLDPRVGRFASADPLDATASDPASLHRYLYAYADPVNRTDPTGLFGDFSLGGLGAAMAIGATLNAITSINPQSTFQSIAIAALEGAAQGAAFYVAGALAARLAWRIATATKVLQVGRFPLVGPSSPIAPYNVLQEVTAGQRGAIQAHHLLEARHLRYWGYSAAEIAEAPAQVLSRAEHAAITKALQAELKTGVAYSREAVWQAYQKVYANYPQYLAAIERYFW
jgi:RHS repeat-associated protein